MFEVTVQVYNRTVKECVVFSSKLCFIFQDVKVGILPNPVFNQDINDK